MPSPPLVKNLLTNLRLSLIAYSQNISYDKNIFWLIGDGGWPEFWRGNSMPLL